MRGSDIALMLEIEVERRRFDGRPTSIDNLTVLCGYHYRNVEALGWSCHIQDGIPMWLPSAWLDREQRPRRNTADHLEIDFGTG